MSLTLLFWLLTPAWAGERTATPPTPPAAPTPPDAPAPPPTPTPAGQKRVHWTEVQQKVRVKPKYPDEARLAAIEGDCMIRMCIDVSGKVTDVYPVTCPMVFAESAVTASKQSIFYPLKESGVPIPVCFDFQYRYKLTDAERKAARPDTDRPDAVVPEPPPRPTRPSHSPPTKPRPPRGRS